MKLAVRTPTLEYKCCFLLMTSCNRPVTLYHGNMRATDCCSCPEVVLNQSDEMLKRRSQWGYHKCTGPTPLGRFWKSQGSVKKLVTTNKQYRLMKQIELKTLLSSPKLLKIVKLQNRVVKKYNPIRHKNEGGSIRWYQDLNPTRDVETQFGTQVAEDSGKKIIAALLFSIRIKACFTDS